MRNKIYYNGRYMHMHMYFNKDTTEQVTVHMISFTHILSDLVTISLYNLHTPVN